MLLIGFSVSLGLGEGGKKLKSADGQKFDKFLTHSEIKMDCSFGFLGINFIYLIINNSTSKIRK